MTALRPKREFRIENFYDRYHFPTERQRIHLVRKPRQCNQGATNMNDPAIGVPRAVFVAKSATFQFNKLVCPLTAVWLAKLAG